jgi:hypothetical protein
MSKKTEYQYDTLALEIGTCSVPFAAEQTAKQTLESSSEVT